MREWVCAVGLGRRWNNWGNLHFVASVPVLCAMTIKLNHLINHHHHLIGRSQQPKSSFKDKVFTSKRRGKKTDALIMISPRLNAINNGGETSRL